MARKDTTTTKRPKQADPKRTTSRPKTATQATAAKKPATKTAAKKPATRTAAKKPATKTAAKKPATKTAAKKPATKTAAKKPPATTAAKKTTAKKPAAKKTDAKRAAPAAAAKKKTAAKKPASTRAGKAAVKAALAGELTVEHLLTHAEELEAEQEERAASEQEQERPVRPPVASRPSNPLHWGYSFCLDDAIPETERAALQAILERFTSLTDRPDRGFFVVAPDTPAERRRAAWDAGGAVIELEQLRAQLPPDDLDARREQLARALAQPTPTAWFEVALLLSTWDAATLPDAIAEAERQLAAWPDELRTAIDAWRDRPELRQLVRLHWGPLDDAPPAGITVIMTQDAKGLLHRQEQLTEVRTLDLSGATGLGDIAAQCTALVGLERLALQQPTYTSGTGTLHLGKLLAAPHLRRLRGLSLYGFKLAARNVAALAECEQPIEHLRLQYAGMKPALAHDLARLASRRPLRTLDLKYNDLGPSGASALFDAPDDWRALRVLDISANEIGDEGTQALARASLDELRWLNISSNDPANQLGPDAARALADAPSLGRLETLILHGHPIGPEGLAALLHSPHLRGLRQLNAGFASFTLASLMECLGAGDPVPLEVLNLGNVDESKSPLDLRGATFLRTVRHLSLDSLEGHEYAAVFTCPHLASLEVLVLGSPYSHEDAALEALCADDPPPNLRYLSLHGWRFTPAQAQTFAASPLGRQLWGLDLMTSYTVPDAWYEFYRAGVPLLGSPLFDAYAPSEHTTTSIFREEL